jgi:hypothetical protein
LRWNFPLIWERRLCSRHICGQRREFACTGDGGDISLVGLMGNASTRRANAAKHFSAVSSYLFTRAVSFTLIALQEAYMIILFTEADETVYW